MSEKISAQHLEEIQELYAEEAQLDIAPEAIVQITDAFEIEHATTKEKTTLTELIKIWGVLDDTDNRDSLLIALAKFTLGRDWVSSPREAHVRFLEDLEEAAIQKDILKKKEEPPKAPQDFRERIPHEEFVKRLKAQSLPREKTLLKCPLCGTLQSMEDLEKAGVGTPEQIEKYFGFSCIGRWTHQLPPPKEKGTQIGCNWTLGGLFQLHRLEVETPDGKIVPCFEIATPEEVAAHLHSQTP